MLNKRKPATVLHRGKARPSTYDDSVEFVHIASPSADLYPDTQSIKEQWVEVYTE